MSEVCFWCKKQMRVKHTYIMEYKTPYDYPDKPYWRRLWTYETHCLECAKESLYDRLNDATTTSGIGRREWELSEYRVRKLRPEELELAV